MTFENCKHLTCVGSSTLQAQPEPACTNSMRKQLVQLFRPLAQTQIRLASWRTKKAVKVEGLALPPAARIDRAEIIRRTEAQVRSSVGEGAGVDEEVIQLIVEARRGIWGGLNGGKASVPHLLAFCYRSLLCVEDKGM